MEQLAAEFKASGLNITQACKAVGVERKTFYNWLESYAYFRRLIDDAEQSVVDDAEAIAWKKVRDGEDYWLKTCLSNHRRSKWTPAVSDAPPAIQITIVHDNVTKLDGAVDAKTS
jgi:transposase-like protein